MTPGHTKGNTTWTTQISDSGIIEGGFTTESAKDLAMLLRSGALPASLHYLTERTVGPSLGADSVRAGVKAAIAGMAAVLIFMLILVNKPGLMGEYRNRPWANAVAGGTSAIMIALTIVLVWTSIAH